MKRMGKVMKAIAAVATVATMASMAACGGSSSGSSDGGGKKITIGIKFDQPGLGFKQGSSYSGFDVDVATYVAKKLGYSANQIVWKEAPSKQRESLLQNGTVDLVVATYTMNKSRADVVDFAGPYFVAAQDILVRANDKKITGPKALDGEKLCSVTGSTSAQHVKDDFSHNTQLMEQPGYAECVTALLSGTVDAVTTDDIILAGLAAAKGNGQLKVLGTPFSEEPYGIGVKKGNTAMVKKVNAAIEDMIKDGSWKAAVEKATKGTGYTPNAKFNPPTKIGDASWIQDK
ncbi:MAG: glutamate ABC transporter substrate-binding protein [Bifidobacterium sp.]|nr:glutamate ABC transporter substrate-binding protein [Bifidobacterium tibiigranuli]MCH3974288.1 glutamate ABC transporter substrate-binding protein [Bifidobacterium tibiigranuli]MCH4188851.1 glutamate ABC transporter substrate-binding protein [Bifidobacterium tibiigranuli]MCH4203244.1 glutamate ABC transporter substrate-binding protein [Bifidobacterium tibiigranuli]MCH4273477.1 glutamate ABC transporter substrate-binding protein [Bifidobacterium tibiigranuli]MCI1211334.1 glutamate ABC transp